MPTLTAVTIATNEEAHVARALASVRGLADEILVVDGGSTDRTVAIARQFTGRVFVNPWPGYGPQKNFALDLADGDWILFVDADEAVSPELAEEIRSLVSGNRQPAFAEASPGGQATGNRDTPSAYFVKIITIFLGKPLRHLWGTNPRLLRRGAVRWDDRQVHEQLRRPDGSTVRLGDPDTGTLSAPLLHPSHYDTLAAYLEKRARYTTRDAEDMLKTGRDRIGKPVTVRPRSPFSVARFLLERAIKQFVRLFVKKRGVLDGWQGWLWCTLSAQYEYIMCRKYLALRRAQRA